MFLSICIERFIRLYDGCMAQNCRYLHVKKRPGMGLAIRERTAPSSREGYSMDVWNQVRQGQFKELQKCTS